MADHILLFCAKMLVGHEGLLSDMSVVGTSLYQKTRHVLYIISYGALRS